MYSIFRTLRDLGLPLDEQVNLCTIINRYKEGKELVFTGMLDYMQLDRLERKGYISMTADLDNPNPDFPVTVELTESALNLIKEDAHTLDFVSFVNSKCGSSDFAYHTKNNRHIGFKIKYKDIINPDWFVELDEYKGKVLADEFGLPTWNIDGESYKLERIEIGRKGRYWRDGNPKKWKLLNEDSGEVWLYAILMKV